MAYIDTLSAERQIAPFDKVVACESRFDSAAVGDHGLANGIAQFHESTFDAMKKEAIQGGDNFEDLSYTDAKSQLILMAWAFSKKYESQWSCTYITHYHRAG